MRPSRQRWWQRWQTANDGVADRMHCVDLAEAVSVLVDGITVLAAMKEQTAKALLALLLEDPVTHHEVMSLIRKAGQNLTTLRYLTEVEGESSMKG